MFNFMRCISVSFAVFALPSMALADITIAVVGGMAGPFEKIGTEFKQGVRGAVEAINKNGGLLNQKLTVLTRDDGCDPKKAVAIANEMVAKKVVFVMGHLCSDASIAASVIYEKSGIIQISPSSTSPLYTERGLKYIFRTTGRDDMQGFVIAEHILRNFRGKVIGIIHDNNGYSKGLAKVAKKFLNKGGIREVMYTQAPGKPYDFSKNIDEIKRKKIQVIFYPGLPGPVPPFAKQLKANKLRLRIIGADAFSGIKFDKSNRRILDGAQFSFPPDPADDRRNKAIKKLYMDSGYTPQAFAFYSYGAVQVWALAAAQAGSLEATKVAGILRASTFDTVLGKIKFDAKGDISNPGFVMYYFSKGKRYYFD